MKFAPLLSIGLALLALNGSIAVSEDTSDYFTVYTRFPTTGDSNCTAGQCTHPIKEWQIIDCRDPSAQCGSTPEQDNNDDMRGFRHVKIVALGPPFAPEGTSPIIGWAKDEDLDDILADKIIAMEKRQWQKQPSSQDCHCSQLQPVVLKNQTQGRQFDNKIKKEMDFDEASCPLETIRKPLGRKDPKGHRGYRELTFGNPVAQVDGIEAVHFTLVDSNPKTPAEVMSFRGNDGSVPARPTDTVGKKLCHVTVSSCAEGAFFPQQQLTKYKSSNHHLSEMGCRLATEAYYRFCDPEGKLPLDDRRADIGRKIEQAFNDFRQLPSVMGKEKTSAFNPTLAKCIVARENPSYQPSRLNLTVCRQVIRKAEMSSAVGLFQLTWTNIEHLLEDNHCSDIKEIRRRVSGNNPGELIVCSEIKDYYNKRRHKEAVAMAKIIQEQISQDSRFQILLGLVAFNHMLAANGNDVGRALKNWYGTKEPDDAERFSGAIRQGCYDCIINHLKTEGECLDSARNQ